MLRTGLVVSLALLLAAGCGGASRRRPPSPPAKLPHALARQWASEADAIAVAASAGDGCRAQTLAHALAEQVSLNSDRVPSRLRTPLLSSVATLSGRISCVQVQTTPQAPPPKKPKPKHGPPGDGHGHGHHGEGDG